MILLILRGRKIYVHLNFFSFEMTKMSLNGLMTQTVSRKIIPRYSRRKTVKLCVENPQFFVCSVTGTRWWRMTTRSTCTAGS